MSDGAVLYHEPTIITILVQSSFLLILNVVNFVLDRAIYCGLIGQILVGMAFGTPGADIIGLEIQQAITDLGYLGLILLVFEGGISTDMHALRSNIGLSIVVALTGILLPIGISFVLIEMCEATILQAFAAGCALSSTSLGTTFTILKASGLSDSRLGVVLTSAAMLDDVVGLVLVQVISNLGSTSGGAISASVVVRPIFVSIAYAALVPALLLVYRFMCKHVAVTDVSLAIHFQVLRSQRGIFVINTILLLAVVASAAYAGTSVLFASYLAGLLISANSSKGNLTTTATTSAIKADGAVKTPSSSNNNGSALEMVPPRDTEPQPQASNMAQPTSSVPHVGVTGELTQRVGEGSDTQGQYGDPKRQAIPDVYEAYYSVVVDRILKPFFFASIGFSIPITRLFDAPTLWRGTVYAVLMAFVKLACGIWLIRFSKMAPESPATGKYGLLWTKIQQYQPQSLYPAGMLGGAMVARGEIGFLISAIAQANGIFDQPGSQGNLFLIVTWAILLCTIGGPITVGLLTRRVKRLRAEPSHRPSSTRDPLGVWADL